MQSLKKKLIPACSLGKQPSHLACPRPFPVCLKYIMILLEDDLAETFSQVSFKSYLPSKNISFPQRTSGFDFFQPCRRQVKSQESFIITLSEVLHIARVKNSWLYALKKLKGARCSEPVKSRVQPQMCLTLLSATLTNWGQQEEPASVISRLLLRIRHMYVDSICLDFHFE